MTEKLLKLFERHLLIKHGITLYNYQKVISRAVFDALIQNLRLTQGATEQDIKNLKRIEIPIEISRQAGKTTDIVATIEFIIIFFTQQFKTQINTGIFAPQREQAKTDFDRLKNMLRTDSDLTNFQEQVDQDKAQDESNAKTLVLPNGSSCYVFPITPTSKPESKTLHLIIIEEAQDADDKILKEQIWPMGSATNAPVVYIGTAGTRICHFYRLGQTSSAIKLYFPDVVRDRRQIFKQTGDAQHLIYEQHVKQLIEQNGIDSDEVQRPYFGKWLIGTGQFLTEQDLKLLVNPARSRTYHHKEDMCFAGIDTAKHPDSTVVTILRRLAKPLERSVMIDGVERKYQIRNQVLNWLELRGENYQDQFEIIKEYLKKYRIMAIGLDSTGQGDFMPDMFERHTDWTDEDSGLYRIKFSAVTKDILYKSLKVVVRELLTELPNLDTREGERFKQQMLDLQQEYKGPLLSVNHPPSGHDDYPDSWALAEHACNRYMAANNASIHFADNRPEAEVKHDGDIYAPIWGED